MALEWWYLGLVKRWLLPRAWPIELLVDRLRVHLLHLLYLLLSLLLLTGVLWLLLLLLLELLMHLGVSLASRVSARTAVLRGYHVAVKVVDWV